MIPIMKGTVVTLSYCLRENDEHGTLLQETDTNNPFVFLFGFGHLLPDFEGNIQGLSVGDKFSFTITAERAFGLYDPEGLIDLPLEIFMDQGQLMEHLLEPGQTLHLRDEEGEIHRCTVKKRGLSSVQVDFNHPLAGKNLHFSGEILDVRYASPEELDHGHVHGPGGVAY
ncbi:MAG: peptidylprolyl isomerase [Flavobacteriales bacterium]|nr:peptidylprolyl isomerase [Flavobacteriales bacterium]